MTELADQAETVPCPICGEPIKATAKKCIHCKEYFAKDKDIIGFNGKTLWDFLGLLFVPFALAILGYWFVNFQTNLEGEREDRLRLTGIAATVTQQVENNVATSTREAANIVATSTREAADIIATSTREVEIAEAEAVRWQQQVDIEATRQSAEWERSKRFEILSRRLDDGQQSLDEISDLINLRFFRLQQVNDAIRARDIDSLNRVWPEYLDAVEMWNIKLITYQNRLRRLVSEEARRRFNNYETDNISIKNPTSIHGQFFVAHNLTLDSRKCLLNSCPNQDELNNEVEIALRRLDYASDAFIDETSVGFLKKASELEDSVSDSD